MMAIYIKIPNKGNVLLLDLGYRPKVFLAKKSEAEA